MGVGRDHYRIDLSRNSFGIALDPTLARPPEIRKGAKEKNEDLQRAFAEIKTLRGIIPICVTCKRIRDDRGFWQRVESYIRDHSEAQFTHAICPDCMKKEYPDLIRDEKTGGDKSS